jgi:hypothetical protein
VIHLHAATAIVLRQLRAHPEICTLEDLHRHRVLAPLGTECLNEVVDLLVAEGKLQEGPTGDWLVMRSVG